MSTKAIGKALTLLAALAVALAGLTGCKEATLGPDLRGDLEGKVLDHASSASLGRVGITTSPPTGALVTDAEGRFRLEDVPAGTYTVTARHPGYRSASVSVSVRENQATEAVLFLEPAPDTTNEETGGSALLQVEVTRWANRTAGDSAFVEVEYRARNTGTAGLSAYEVYFRIDAGGEAFHHEVHGDSLHPGQSDVGRFERRLAAAAADAVTVHDVWFAQ